LSAGGTERAILSSSKRLFRGVYPVLVTRKAPSPAYLGSMIHKKHFTSEPSGYFFPIPYFMRLERHWTQSFLPSAVAKSLETFILQRLHFIIFIEKRGLHRPFWLFLLKERIIFGWLVFGTECDNDFLYHGVSVSTHRGIEDFGTDVASTQDDDGHQRPLSSPFGNFSGVGVKLLSAGFSFGDCQLAVRQDKQ
jgi:hypothetical protein